MMKARLSYRYHVAQCIFCDSLIDKIVDKVYPFCRGVIRYYSYLLMIPICLMLRYILTLLLVYLRVYFSIYSPSV